MKKFLALLLSVAMLLIPMTAFADTIDEEVDYVYDKITITGEFETADGAEEKIATLVVVNPNKNLADFATDNTVINWADQCVVKDGKFTFVIDTSETGSLTGYHYYISAPGVARTFEGTFDYSAADMETALMAKLNDTNLRAAGIDEFIRVHAADRITEVDATLVRDYTRLSNPMNVANAMVGKRAFVNMVDFATKLRALVNAQANAPADGGSAGGGINDSGDFTGGAGTDLLVPPETNPFLDIANTYWGKDTILNLYNKGIVKGNNGYFRPDNTITRAEFVQMVVMAFGFGMNGDAANFTDVADSDWFANSVQIAYANGVVNGTSATTFSPLANITRQDMMTILYNAAKAKGVNLTNGSAEFTDADSISEYAQDAVAAMAGSKVVSGYTDGSVKPLNNASRAEAAAMLSRLLEVK